MREPYNFLDVPRERNVAVKFGQSSADKLCRSNSFFEQKVFILKSDLAEMGQFFKTSLDPALNVSHFLPSYAYFCSNYSHFLAHLWIPEILFIIFISETCIKSASNIN